MEGLMVWTVADPGGAQRSSPPTPANTIQKIYGHLVAWKVSQVIATPSPLRQISGSASVGSRVGFPQRSRILLTFIRIFRN